MSERFRSKAVEVEAVQWTGENREEVEGFAPPIPLRDGMALHAHEAIRGDWIVKRDGIFSVCSTERFEATYEPASAPTPPALDAEDRPKKHCSECGYSVVSLTCGFCGHRYPGAWRTSGLFGVPNSEDRERLGKIALYFDSRETAWADEWAAFLRRLASHQPEGGDANGPDPRRGTSPHVTGGGPEQIGSAPETSLSESQQEGQQ